MMFQRYEVLMATPALSHWDVKVGGTSMEEMRGAWLEVMMMMWKCHDDVYYYIC